MLSKNKIALSFFLLSAHLSYSICGYLGENGKSQEVTGQKFIAKNGVIMSERSFIYFEEINEKTFSRFDVFDCNSDYCSLALRHDKLGPVNGCDTEEDLIESIKVLYGRNIPKGIKKAPFLYGKMSKKLDLQSIYVGCDFLKLKIPKNIDSISAFLMPQRTGFCPIIFDYPSICDEEHCKYFFEKGINLFQITRDEKSWKINVKQYTSPLSRFIDEDSEFIYSKMPLDLFVEPCFKNECFFVSIEKMPFSNNLFTNENEKAVLVRQIERIKSLCDFIKVKKTDEPGYTGMFIVDGVGTCKIQIQHKLEKIKIINVISEKVNNNYRILIK